MEYFKIDLVPTVDMSYCILEDSPEDTFLIEFKMAKGIPAAPEYPGKPVWKMTKTYSGIKLPSLIACPSSLLVVHKDLVDVLRASQAPMEALPFTLVNHKGRVASEDYFIVNPLAIVECLDRTRSEIKYSEDYPDEIIRIKKYVLDPRKLDGVPAVFRLKEDRRSILLSHAILTELKRLNPTNVYLEKLEQ